MRISTLLDAHASATGSAVKPLLKIIKNIAVKATILCPNFIDNSSLFLGASVLYLINPWGSYGHLENMVSVATLWLTAPQEFYGIWWMKILIVNKMPLFFGHLIQPIHLLTTLIHSHYEIGGFVYLRTIVLFLAMLRFVG